MRTLVIGASGMLGNAIYRGLKRDREECEGWSGSTKRTPDRLPLVPKDLVNDEWSRDLVALKPELVINCVALTDAEYCEGHASAAWDVNSWLPGALSGVCAQNDIRFVHVSTDAVYDDSYPGLRNELSPTKPKSVYAETKLEGEGHVLTKNPDALVVRTTMVGWTLPGKRPKFAETILARLTNRTPLFLWKDAYFSPLHVDMLGDVLRSLASQDEMPSGVLNVGSRRPVSKADFGRLVADVFGLNRRCVRDCCVDDSEAGRLRTKNVGLNVSEAEKILGPMPSVSREVSQLYEEAHNGTAKKIRGRETYP